MLFHRICENIKNARGCIIEQVALNKSCLLVKNILQNTQTLHVFTMTIKKDSIYKCI
jgi:hypothetical protein